MILQVIHFNTPGIRALPDEPKLFLDMPGSRASYQLRDLRVEFEGLSLAIPIMPDRAV